MLSIQTHAEAFTPPDKDRILTTLKPGHPRLMMDANTLARIKEQIARDTVAAKIYRRVTRASVKLDGQTALLTRRGKHLKAEILSPSDAIFTVLNATPLPTSPNPKQADNEGRRKLAIHFTDVTKLQIKVKLSPEVSP